MRSKLILVFILCSPILGCSLIFPTTIPIGSVAYLSGQEQSDTLFIMLPGRGSESENFFKNEFIQNIKKAGVNADTIVVDAHFGYYYEKNLTKRLYEDVVMPARQKGYQNIWMLGISMGGLGTGLYASQHPDTLTGIILIAPFLGDKELIEEINGAGTIKKWMPKVPLTEDHYQEALWFWLKEYSNSNNHLPRFLLGYGQEDKFNFSSRLLAEVLPDNQVCVIRGNHDWNTWNKIFYRLLLEHFSSQSSPGKG